MADIESIVNTRLRASTALNALVGTKIRPLLLKQGELVGVTYHPISRVRDSAHGSDTGHVTSRFQVNSFATTYAGAIAIRNEVRASLQRWSGSTAVVDTFTVDESQFFDPEADVYQFSSDFTIHHKE